MNTAQAPSALDDTTRTLAAVLCELIQEADESYIKDEPEDAFTDLAAKLVLRLSRNQLTVAPSARVSRDEAARRIFDIFSTWLQMQPDRAYVTRLNEEGKIEVTTLSPNGVQAFFKGGDVQDAYAQMAQVLLFNGGAI